MTSDNTNAVHIAAALGSELLRPTCDPMSLGFQTTDELESIDTLIGQDRALRALRFGCAIDRPGYNLFALGPAGTGRHTAICAYLEEKAAEEPAPDDWIYVHDFSSEHQPKAMRLPAGTAMKFHDAMNELIDDLKSAIPAIFQSDEYRDRRRAIDSEIEEMHEKSLASLRQKAEAENIGILRTPMGFVLAPLKDGEVIKPDVFNALPKAERDSIEAKIADLQNELTEILEHGHALEKQGRDQIRALNAELTSMVVDASIKTIADRFSGMEAIQSRLSLVRDDLIGHAELFIRQSEKEQGGVFPPDVISTTSDPHLNRYRVNVMVANDGDGDNKGAPMIIEDNPIVGNLVGRVEHLSQFGALITDFTMIRPGALHLANGGYLVLDARKVLSEMFSWEAIKRALRSKTISIVSVAEQMSLVSTISLQPEPIPLDLKVVLIGERILYYLLCEMDPEFSELFKVQIDFDEQMPRSTENVADYARLIATIARREHLHALSAAGVARVIDEVARLAEDSERMTLNIGRLADLLREADFWSTDAGHDQITDQDVVRAVDEQIRRADRLRERVHEQIERGTVLIETKGETAGQINALAVSSLGNFRFARPSRITARVRMGTGKVVDIERESRLGGPLHSKGILILSGFLAANYALDTPMSLWASIVFEQSYGGIDGDSASSAELYAILSALADVPIKQSLAVTGSVNQYGEVQAIGGVNEKIEGFYDICYTRGLTGNQGVLIPAANVKHLMLRPDVVQACTENRFRVYPVLHIGQGIELLTGLPAGERLPDGRFPDASLNARVEATLRRYAESRKSFTEESANTDRVDS